MNVLITSATSATAQIVAGALAGTHTLRLTDLSRNSGASAGGAGGEIVACDLNHEKPTDELVAGIDAIVNIGYQGQAGEATHLVDYHTRCMYNLLQAASDAGVSRFQQLAEELESAGHPVLVINAPDSGRHGTAGALFRWQFATAAAASLMDIYPFDQPDVEAAKVRARELLSNLNQDLTTVPLAESLDSLEAVSTPAYVALIAFLPESAALTAAFSSLRKAISEKTGAATTVGYGPRYLHSIGQLYKGGPRNAVVLGFVSGKYDDLPVPGASYTFGQLSAAQAAGDFSIMAERGQKVMAVRLGASAIEELATATERAFG